ncbi:MAG: hypothetical protein ACRDND_08650 [Streptosporangiaceae bacterium]
MSSSTRSASNGHSFNEANGPGSAVTAVLPSSHWAVLSGLVADPFYR